MSDVEIDFSDDNLSINMGSDLGEDNFKFASSNKKSKKKKKKVSILKNSSFGPKPNLPPMMDKSFQMFSNPTKQKHQQAPIQHDDNDDNDENSENDGEYQGEDERSVDSDQNYQDYGEQEPQPSSGFATIEDEKQDLLYKFYRMENKGIKLAKKFNMHSDIDEMRSEYRKIVRDAEVTSSLKFSKRMLLAVVSGTEFLNKRYDPLGVELNGCLKV